jgi:hypothetical protein
MEENKKREAVLILNKRRCGNTTRIVDDIIQRFFNGEKVEIKDHTDISGRHGKIMLSRRVIRRLQLEHCSMTNREEVETTWDGDNLFIQWTGRESIYPTMEDACDAKELTREFNVNGINFEQLVYFFDDNTCSVRTHGIPPSDYMETNYFTKGYAHQDIINEVNNQSLNAEEYANTTGLPKQALMQKLADNGFKPRTK